MLPKKYPYALCLSAATLAISGCLPWEYTSQTIGQKGQLTIPIGFDQNGYAVVATSPDTFAYYDPQADTLITLPGIPTELLGKSNSRVLTSSYRQLLVDLFLSAEADTVEIYLDGLPTPITYPDQDVVYSQSIDASDNNVVVGNAIEANEQSFGFTYDNGTYTPLPSCDSPELTSQTVFAMSPNGDYIVGECGTETYSANLGSPMVVYNGELHMLEGNFGKAVDASDNGLIAINQYQFSAEKGRYNPIAYYYDMNTQTMEQIGPSTLEESHIIDMNRHGVSIGQADNPVSLPSTIVSSSNNNTNAFVYRPGRDRGMDNLNLITEKSLYTDFIRPYHINDDGVIIAWGTIYDPETNDNRFQSFLIVPND